ncbi:MAG: chromosome segregation protein SMC [Bradyrhizobiaceae bacterium]|nr:chromosome segregation protein SMC [Bradyrhizobiaceae bacterium]
MQFTRLRLIGFKSFVEPSEFLIEPGLTGIVGPNGCGKSNLVEALRWVMGEASHKAMRAPNMDDVIFAGTTNRPARNMAEVVLSIDNTDRSAPEGMNDETLEVSRRIEREAGSAYRINGREVRARDVQILFADASSGSRSPALVRQGQIGEIINAKPEQRRRLLEEAAGIAGLHARKHEAETRLKSTEHNLQRVEDIITQIAGQMDGLKRQARQAARYKTVSAEIRKQQAILAALRWREAETAVAEAERALDLAVRTVAERTVAHGEAGRARTEAAERIGPLRDAEAASAAALQRLTAARADLEREEARAKARTEELERRLTQLAQDMERERALATDAQNVLKRLAGEEEALAADTQGSGSNEASAHEKLAAAEAALARSEQAFADTTSALADLTAKRSQLDRSITEADERIGRLEREIAEIDQEASTLQGTADADMARLGAESASAHDALAAADARALRAETARSAAAQALDAARRPLAQAEQQLHRLETEARTLAKVLDVEKKKLWPPVLDVISVEQGFETALGAALGDDLDAPTDSAAPIYWAGADAAGDPELPAGVEPLSAHVTAPAALARRLAQVGIVSRIDGKSLATQLKPGQRLVSREGDLWRWDGLTATADAPTAAARRLAARNRLAELDREIEAAREQVRVKTEEAAKAEEESRLAEAAETEARNHYRAMQAAFEAARETLSQAERKASDRMTRLSALAEARARLTAGREEAAGTKTASETARGELLEASEVERRLEECRQIVAQDRATLAAARAEVEGIERERSARAQRLTAISAERAAWHEREEGAASRLKAIEERLNETRIERASLDEAPAAFEAQRQELLSKLTEAESLRQQAGDRLAEAESVLADLERAARAAQDALSSAREESARAEARIEGARERKTGLLRDVSEALGGTPDPARIAEVLGDDPKTIDPNEVDAQLQKLNETRERLGGVNLRAEDELREVETQYNNLTGERDDLIEAIKRLRQGISNLDREARARLVASFDTVNEHFKKLFTGLFAGGTAELILTDHEDPLQAGLDIIARPPGKKPQNLSLLSGGEQALTAMALIFAVFLTNPAPICVLDEVDAPLDDHNVDRFCNLLDEMTRLTKTRFIVVTHNPITMARVHRLYGVTMAEQGISQLVSVSLEQAEQLREAS